MDQGLARIVGPGSATSHPWSQQSAKLTLHITVSNRQPLWTLQACAEILWWVRMAQACHGSMSSSNIEDEMMI